MFMRQSRVAEEGDHVLAVGFSASDIIGPDHRIAARVKVLQTVTGKGGTLIGSCPALIASHSTDGACDAWQQW